MSNYQPLPEEALALCRETSAPPRLVAHLTLVHDFAQNLLQQLHQAFPTLGVNDADILFGAATHDLGKTAHPDELIEPGERHETDGPAVLKSLGVSSRRARFAFTHSNWDSYPPPQLEDLLVALSDKCWKGTRFSDLETMTAEKIASATNTPEPKVSKKLNAILTQLAASADQRIAWQAQFPTTEM
jgi:hypothetical protein